MKGLKAIPSCEHTLLGYDATQRELVLIFYKRKRHTIRLSSFIHTQAQLIASHALETHQVLKLRAQPDRMFMHAKREAGTDLHLHASISSVRRQ
jgi:hypothetical protein